ncbi:hypothetical protein ACFWOT_32525 [Streptomyces sp. NPDC058440]|uniref:hypothetical protein n=1 Tax=Streptomyces sp. NPDC058440 TaxID=3346501 RepID=UPI003655BB63
MPSVLGLLEAREKKVREDIARLREEAERVQAALGEAERALDRLVNARVTVIVSVLESEAGREGLRCQQLARALGLEVVPAKVEGLRSKAKRLVDRGWALQVRSGVFTALTAPAG